MHVYDEAYSNIAACKDADRTQLNHKGSTNKQEKETTLYPTACTHAS